MKAIRAAAAIVFSVMVFVLSFLAFFPFGQGAELLWRKAVRAAGERGFALDSSEVSAPGFLPSAELTSVRLKSPLLSGEAGRVTVSLSLKDGVAALAPVFRVRLERVSAKAPMPGEPPIYLELAEAKIALRRDSMEAFDIKVAGELQASGRAVFSRSSLSLIEADVSLGGQRADLLAALGSVLPLRRGEGGTWKLEKVGRGSGGSN